MFYKYIYFNYICHYYNVFLKIIVDLQCYISTVQKVTQLYIYIYSFSYSYIHWQECLLINIEHNQKQKLKRM